MKHIFILNPVAGHQDAESKFLPRILEAVKAEDVDYEIHRTMNIGDGENYVRNRCIAFPDEKLRFYAVGGDGTLNEVANGVFGFPNAEIASAPAEPAMILLATFSIPKLLDIKSQIRGRSKKIDLIQYGDRIIVNMLNIADCEVVTKMEAIKEKTFLRGPLAYITGWL